MTNMKIEKYFYSENKKYWDSLIEEAREGAKETRQALQEMSEEEREIVFDEQLKSVTELLSKLMPLPEEVCTIIEPSKYNRFLELANASVDFAQREATNLLVYTEGMSGCISFVAEEMTCINKETEMLGLLNAAADEVHIATSVDMGKGSPTDIENGVRIEFWFDFYSQIELK